MIRGRLSALFTRLLLSGVFLAEPCLVLAGSQSQKPPQKPTPPSQQPTTPSHTSRTKKYESPNTYHPHGKSGSKSTRGSHH